jgi:hypothetical protein
MQILAQYKSVFIAVALFLLGFLLVYLWGRKSGTVKPITLPNDTPGNQALSPQEAEYVRKLANDLYSDMDGINFLKRDHKLYEDFLNTSDRIFVAIYNDFNYLYYAKSKQTLRQWIEGEQFWWQDVFKGNQIKNLLIRKFNRLNLA